MKRMKQRRTWADLDVLKMSLAALFCTFWSLERRYLGQPPKSELQEPSLERTNAHNSSFGDIFGQIVAYYTNPTKFKIADTTNGGDLLLQERVGSRQTPRL